MISENQPKVLVFCQCYNHEKYVDEAMKCVLNQTYSNFEFFLVDDGSSDRTADIIETYLTDKRVKLVRLKENTSAYGASKIVDEYIKKSDAKYIADMSSDDIWELNKLEMQIQFLEENPSYKACFTWDTLIYEEGANTEAIAQGYSHRKSVSRFENLNWLFQYGNFYNATSFVELRETYLEIGGLNWTYRNLQDFDLWIRIQLKYPVYLMDECLTIYRKHPTNISTAPGVYFRDRNEFFAILSNNMMNMDDALFKKIFYPDFVYNTSSSPNELLAEKVGLLLRSDSQVHIQEGFLLYMMNSQNQEFVDLMEERFSLNKITLHAMTSSYGMEFILVKNEPAVKYNYTSLEALFDMIDRGVNLKNLHILKSKALSDLLYSIFKIYSEPSHFLSIRKLIWDQQNCPENSGKSLIVIGSDCEEKMVNELLNNSSADYYTIIPTERELLKDECNVRRNIDCKVEFIDLVDVDNHRVKYLWEMGIEQPTDIIYVGCCDDEYPTMNIINNVSLATRQWRCLLPRKTETLNEYDYLLRVLDP